jgi:hypothetical protein
MNYQHKELASGRWFKLTFFEQMANIGSEIERTINWKNKNNPDYSGLAFNRALELLDLTISDKNNVSRLKELVRVRETLADYFAFNNIYKSNDDLWRKYFSIFNYAARAKS